MYCSSLCAGLKGYCRIITLIVCLITFYLFVDESEIASFKSAPDDSGGNILDSRAGIDLVTLIISKDFAVFFGNRALDSWLRYIRDVRSVTFIGKEAEWMMWRANMTQHYANVSLPIRWVNESYFRNKYSNNRSCCYTGVFQQMVKLHVFDIDGLRDNVLIVDSDTVWSNYISFVGEDNSTTMVVHDRSFQPNCTGMDAVTWVERITAGPSSNHSLAPISTCRRQGHHHVHAVKPIVHHMLFQRDVMQHMHSTIAAMWNVTNLWDAVVDCWHLRLDGENACRGRISEYTLYFSWVSNLFSERVNLYVVDNRSFKAVGGLCDAEEMECCRQQGVLLKACHSHRSGQSVGMCCDLSTNVLAF